MQLHIPWLELAVLLPLLGALLVRGPQHAAQARTWALAASGAALLCSLAAWIDFATLNTSEAHDHWDIFGRFINPDIFVMDELSAPVLPLTALVFFLTILATLRTKIQRFSFALTLVSETLVLLTLCCQDTWTVVLLMIVATVPPWVELRRRGNPTRVYTLHMAVFSILLLAGQALISVEGNRQLHSTFAVGMLTLAVLVRSGIVPVHCWMTDLFEYGSFGTALLFVTPLTGAYAAIRLVLPVAPDWILQTIAVVSLITAVYSAGMALVQTDARRFFCYLFLSHSSLVLVGLELATPVGLGGALCVWLSTTLALTGFGLTLRSVESRVGRVALGRFHGLFDHMPMLGAFFLLTGLASIGFPGTIGFIAVELLVEGAIDVSPAAGVAVMIAAALNGLAVLLAYFRVFNGTRHSATVDLTCRMAERIAVVTLTLLILGGGLIPQPGVASRYHAAAQLVKYRVSRNLSDPEEADPATERPLESADAREHRHVSDH